MLPPRKLRIMMASTRNFLCLFILVLIIFFYKMKRNHQGQIATKISKSAMKYFDFVAQGEEKTLQINTIKRLISKYNSEQRVTNLDFFGPLKPTAPIFIIFVDKYKINLKYLLVSLVQLLGIEDALIIFSHSCFDENVNNLIKTIDFTRVLQIFYPYSLQIYPHEFPGYQQGDCPPDMDMDTGQSINCTGADTPDIHGRYRDPLHSQMKLFWWWTMNEVFENLSYTKEHKGIFTILEDDMFLMEDFIFMTAQMKKISHFISQCDFISLETSSFKFPFYDKSTYTVEFTTWEPKDHFSVLSFDASVWSAIAAHYYLFCHIDDYSWSRSLYYLSLNRKDGSRFKVMSSTLPRAFKTSSSVLFNQLVQYNMVQTVFQILDLQERNKIHLYPSHLEVYLNVELDEDDFVIFDYVDNNGGWNDPRDKAMCNNITTNKIKKVIMDMDHEFHLYDFA